MCWQRLAHGVQVRRIGNEQGHAFFIAGFKVLRTRFNGGQLNVGTIFGFAFDHAYVVKVPRHSAHLALAKAHAHIGRSAIGVVSQAFHHHRHAVGCVAFIDHAGVVDGISAHTRAFFDCTVQSFFGHGSLAGSFNRHAQARIARRVTTTQTGSDCNFLDQLAEQLAFGVRSQGLALGFPLRSHGGPFFEKEQKMPRTRPA